MLWGTLGGLALLTASGVGLTIAVLRMEQRLEFRVVQEMCPYIDAVRAMDDALDTMVSASRGYLEAGQTAFSAQYDQALREYDKSEAVALEMVRDPRDTKVLNDFRVHFVKIKELQERQKQLRDDHRDAEAQEIMLDVAQRQRTAPDLDRKSVV